VGLYERLNIDLKHLVNKETLKLKISATLKQFFTDYRQGIPKDATEIAYRSIVQDNQIDFGRLDEALQEEIILSISKSKSAQSDVRLQINLERLDSKIIQTNKESIIEKFAQETYVKKLNFIYESLLDMKKDRLEYVEGEDLLSSFLSPKRLNLLRT
jgi:replication initiation and membrane attachment protein DnaB